MENKPSFTRRQALKAIGGLGVSLLLPSNAYARTPSELCPAHFKGLPNRTRGPDGEIYIKQRDGLYHSNSGKVMAGDGYDMLLAKNFMDVEQDWENAIQTGTYMARPLFFENPDINALRTCMGDEKWFSLTDNYQKRTIDVWGEKDQGLRQFICGVYLNVFNNFYNRYLNDNQKTDFRRFVKAYRSAIDSSNAPANKMFMTRDGSVHKTYTTTCPWLCLSFPDVSDRALIFGEEVFHQNNGKRINWNFVRD